MQSSEMVYITSIAETVRGATHYCLAHPVTTENPFFFMVEASQLQSYLTKSKCYLANATVDASGYVKFKEKDGDTYLRVNSSGYPLKFKNVPLPKLHPGNKKKDESGMYMPSTSYIVVELEKDKDVAIVMSAKGVVRRMSYNTLVKSITEGLIISNAVFENGNIRLLNKGLYTLSKTSVENANAGIFETQPNITSVQSVQAQPQPVIEKSQSVVEKPQLTEEEKKTEEFHKKLDEFESRVKQDIVDTVKEIVQPEPKSVQAEEKKEEPADAAPSCITLAKQGIKSVYNIDLEKLFVIDGKQAPDSLFTVITVGQKHYLSYQFLHVKAEKTFETDILYKFNLMLQRLEKHGIAIDDTIKVLRDFSVSFNPTEEGAEEIAKNIRFTFTYGSKVLSGFHYLIPFYTDIFRNITYVVDLSKFDLFCTATLNLAKIKLENTTVDRSTVEDSLCGHREASGTFWNKYSDDLIYDANINFMTYTNAKYERALAHAEDPTNNHVIRSVNKRGNLFNLLKNLHQLYLPNKVYNTYTKQMDYIRVLTGTFTIGNIEDRNYDKRLRGRAGQRTTTDPRLNGISNLTIKVHPNSKITETTDCIRLYFDYPYGFNKDTAKLTLDLSASNIRLLGSHSILLQIAESAKLVLPDICQRIHDKAIVTFGFNHINSTEDYTNLKVYGNGLTAVNKLGMSCSGIYAKNWTDYALTYVSLDYPSMPALDSITGVVSRLDDLPEVNNTINISEKFNGVIVDKNISAIPKHEDGSDIIVDNWISVGGWSSNVKPKLVLSLESIDRGAAATEDTFGTTGPTDKIKHPYIIVDSTVKKLSLSIAHARDLTRFLTNGVLLVEEGVEELEIDLAFLLNTHNRDKWYREAVNQRIRHNIQTMFDAIILPSTITRFNLTVSGDYRRDFEFFKKYIVKSICIPSNSYLSSINNFANNISELPCDIIEYKNVNYDKKDANIDMLASLMDDNSQLITFDYKLARNQLAAVGIKY